MCIRNDAWRPRSEREERKGGQRGERSGGGGPGGHAGDEGEELVMVMRRCNDSSAVRSELALSFSVSFSSFFFFFLCPFCFARPLPSLYLRMAMIPGTAHAPFYALLFTGTWLLSARLAIFAVRLCMWSARALIRRIMGRLLTLNTVNNSRSGAALSVTRNRRCSNEYFAVTMIIMTIILIYEFKDI